MRRTPFYRVTICLGASVLAVAACGSDQHSAGSSTPQSSVATTVNAVDTSISTATQVTIGTVTIGPTDTASGSTAPEGSAVMSSGPIDPGLGPHIAIAVADLVQRIGVPADQIEVSSATLEQWPDSSIGCPQKGMQYTQVLTDGALIVLTHEGKTYKYHSGGSRQPFYCADSKATPSGATPSG